MTPPEPLAAHATPPAARNTARVAATFEYVRCCRIVRMPASVPESLRSRRSRPASGASDAGAAALHQARQRRRGALLVTVARGRSLGRGLGRWMLHEREHAACHEPRAAHRFAGARHLGDLHDATCGRDLDPSAGTGGADLIRARAVVGGDDDLHAIAL